MGSESLSLQACEAIVSKDLSEFIGFQETYVECLVKYEGFMSSASGRHFNVRRGLPVSILSELDGVY